MLPRRAGDADSGQSEPSISSLYARIIRGTSTNEKRAEFNRRGEYVEVRCSRKWLGGSLDCVQQVASTGALA